MNIPARLEQLQNRLLDCEERATNISSSMSETGKVSGGHVTDKIGDNVAIMADIRDEIKALTAQYENTEKFVIQLSSTDAEIATIFQYYFLDGLTYKQIAHLMKKNIMYVQRRVDKYFSKKND